MWWEYVFVFGAIVLSIAYLVRYYYKKMKAPTCDCEVCPFMKNNEFRDVPPGNLNCCNGCAYPK